MSETVATSFAVFPTPESEFLTELQALLKKHHAFISWNCGAGSDMHGVYEEHMTIEMGNKVVLTIPNASYICASNVLEAILNE